MNNRIFRTLVPALLLAAAACAPDPDTTKQVIVHSMPEGAYCLVQRQGVVFTHGITPMTIPVDADAKNMNVACSDQSGSPVWVSLESHQAMSPVALDLKPNPQPGTAGPGVLGRQLLLARAETVTPYYASLVRLNAPRGVIIRTVEKGGVAAASGLRPGDVILSLDEAPLSGLEDMVNILNVTRAGSTVTALVWRSGGETRVRLRF